MQFVSTTGKGQVTSFRNAVLNNLPADGGLYIPKEIPLLDQGFLEEIPNMELSDIAAIALRRFCGNDIDEAALSAITKRVYNFPIPIKQVTSSIQCLELYHGPTYAFKDIGAKFLAECLSYFNSDRSRDTLVLVATSGDTGGAVANGFLGVEGVKVIILYPKGKVSELQEKQLTTLGQNIIALEVDGTFDDCQSMVKSAFADRDLADDFNLSSANSINIARWLPQSIYYYVPYQQGRANTVMSVPSGNYGNLTSGVLAQKMGIPIKRFIAGSNENDTVPRYLNSGFYEPASTIPTLANAMDVSDPSNFIRLLALFDNSYDQLRRNLDSFTLNDQGIKESIKRCWDENNYLTDPHGAIGYEALRSTASEGIFLGTAHYCKFLPTMSNSLGELVETPDFAAELMSKEKNAVAIAADYGQLKDYILN